MLATAQINNNTNNKFGIDSRKITSDVHIDTKYVCTLREDCAVRGKSEARTIVYESAAIRDYETRERKRKEKLSGKNIRQISMIRTEKEETFKNTTAKSNNRNNRIKCV